MAGLQATLSVAPEAVRILGRGRDRRGFEAATATAPSFEAAQRNLRDGGIRQTLDEAEHRLRAIEQREGDVDPTTKGLRRDLLAHGEEALNRIARDGAARVTVPERASIEALISLTDRPAIRVENGTIDRNHPELGPWQAAFVLSQPEIEAVFRSVGRVDTDGTHIGTGFVVADGVVMTNRHVIECFAAPAPRRARPARWVLQSADVTIDFSDGASGGADAFRIKAIIAAGAEPIEDFPIDFKKLDLALLDVETTNTAGRRLPPPVALLSNSARTEERRQVFTIGYPARPQVLPSDRNGAIRMDVVERLRAIFRHRYGVKYFSPGLISTVRGEVADDPRGWVFSHDATTLGGSSGSAAIDFADPIAAVGLHFAGDWLRANHAHALALVKSSGEIGRLDGLDWIA